MSKSPVVYQQKYFLSIDGLRTLAVMLVVVYHAGYSWMKGGFIGVDIFFVISGFLITGNITRELNKGNWSFPRFYMRRIARLFPALFVTIALTLVLSYWVLNPDDLARLGRVSILTVLSSSNIFFWLEFGYFDISADFKPLLHTWSLAVEEQFYFVWPLLLFLLFKLAKARAIVIGLLFLGLLSFIAALWFSQEAPTAVFFLTPFRGYQFALGGLISLIGVSKDTKLASAFGGLSVVGLIAIALIVNGASPHFAAAALPAVATAIIIWASRTRSIHMLFGTTPMIWIGQRSYSIYLVHWPLIVLWKMKTDFQFSGLEALVAILLSIILGAALHWLVEKPFRFRPSFTQIHKIHILAGCNALGIAIIVVGAHFWGFSGFPWRVPQELKAIASNLNGEWVKRQKSLRSGVCNILVYARAGASDNSQKKQNFSNFDIKSCATPPKGKTAYLIVGDSFAGDTYLVFKDAYPDVYFGQITIPGCFLKIPSRLKTSRLETCRRLYDLALTKLSYNKNFDGIILASNWQDRQYFIVEELIKAVPHSNFKVFLVGQHIRFSERLPTIILSSKSRADAVRKIPAFLKPEPGKINETLKTRFQDRIKFVDFMQLQCPDKCDIFTPSQGLMYLDDSHLSVDGAKLLAKRLVKTQPRLLN